MELENWEVLELHHQLRVLLAEDGTVYIQAEHPHLPSGAISDFLEHRD
jgi:hypothetical protein